MSELPRGWVKARLRDLVKSPIGWNPRQAASNVFRYVDIEAVDNERQRIGTARELPVAEAPSRARVAIEKGDVLFSLVRPYLKNIARVPEELHGHVASTAFVALRPKTGICTDFVFYQLVQDGFIKSIPTYGNSPPAARDDEFLNLEIPIAPTNEQTRIASKLEELLSDLDASVLALERARGNLKRYRAAVLKAAVEGRLTEKWRAARPDVEPASKLLERILAERRKKWEEAQLKKYADKGQSPPKGWKEKYPEPLGPQIAGLRKLSETWCWASLDQVSMAERPIAYGVLQPGTDVDGGVPLVRVGDINDGRIRLDDLKRIDPNIAAQFPRTRLYGGEILLTIVGTIGRTAVAPASLSGANTARAVAVLPVLELLDARYIEICLRERSMQARLTTAAHEVARKTLNLEDVRPAPIPLIPLLEQRQIIDEVERAYSISDSAMQEVESSSVRSAKLRQGVLKRAFEGKLVPQDPNDEPASELLARIRAARAGEGKAKRHARAGNGGAV